MRLRRGEQEEYAVLNYIDAAQNRWRATEISDNIVGIKKSCNCRTVIYLHELYFSLFKYILFLLYTFPAIINFSEVFFKR